MAIECAQTTLNNLYATRTALITGQLQSYTIGDRTITLFNMIELNKLIWYYESAVTSNQPIIADLRFTGAGQEAYGAGYLP